MKTYKTEHTALRRVVYLVHTKGVWPGIVHMGDGTYRLTYDPDAWLDEVSV
jgi:hypothetical protein